MALSLNKPKLDNLASDIWKFAERLRGKVADPAIRTTVEAHREDRLYLEGPYRGQVNENIQTTYDERGRYDELADPKYIDTGGIFDIMAITVIRTHLSLAA